MLIGLSLCRVRPQVEEKLDELREAMNTER
jgi:hypothetical protein